MAFLATVGIAAVGIGPRVLGYRTLFVRSPSMSPGIPVGALAVYLPVDADELRPGDVIAFRSPGRGGHLVTHRIVRIEPTPREGDVFVTKGDANATEDPWRIPATGRGWRYAFAVPYAGYAVAMLGLPAVRLATLLAAVLTLAGACLGALWRPRRLVVPA